MDYRTRVSVAAQNSSVVAYALAQVGKPYKFGTTGPDTFDCSGLCEMALATIDFKMEHNSGLQAQQLQLAGLLTSPDNRKVLVPGDWVGWYGSFQDPASISHCGIYVGRSVLGNYMVVAAVDEQYGVKKHRMNWALPPSCFGAIVKD